jgi:type IV pilus assembly protein PilA
MVLEKIKQDNSKGGFTIVALLVVIVVIAILAAITIVSYTGVTNRAKTAKALSNASAVQSYVEVYNADNGAYPVNLAAFAGTTSATLSSGISVIGGNSTTAGIDSSNGETTISWCYYTSGVGGEIRYYKFDGTASVQSVRVGAVSGSCTKAT